jgi:hypothetical protein
MGFSGVVLPRDGSNAITSIDLVHKKIHDKKFYDYQEIFFAVPNNGVIRLSMRSADISCHLTIILDCEGKAYFRSYSDTTYIDEGTAGYIFNRFIDDAPPSTATVRENVVVDQLGQRRFRKLILGGTGPQSSGASNGSRVETVLCHNHELYFEITNVSGQAKDIGVTLEWYEANDECS